MRTVLHSVLDLWLCSFQLGTSAEAAKQNLDQTETRSVGCASKHVLVFLQVNCNIERSFLKLHVPDPSSEDV